jgi:hypothetical protein
MYAGLTDLERGKLAFGYSIKKDALEVARITSTMSDQHYFIGLPHDYRRMVGDLIHLSLFYGVEYWRKVAFCLSLMGGGSAMARSPDFTDEEFIRVTECFRKAEGDLLALEQAFDEVCAGHGLDSALMRDMAGERFYVMSEEATPCAVSLAGYREAFANLLESV